MNEYIITLFFNSCIKLTTAVVAVSLCRFAFLKLKYIAGLLLIPWSFYGFLVWVREYNTGFFRMLVKNDEYFKEPLLYFLVTK